MNDNDNDEIQEQDENETIDDLFGSEPDKSLDVFIDEYIENTTRQKAIKFEEKALKKRAASLCYTIRKAWEQTQTTGIKRAGLMLEADDFMAWSIKSENANTIIPLLQEIGQIGRANHRFYIDDEGIPVIMPILTEKHQEGLIRESLSINPKTFQSIMREITDPEGKHKIPIEEIEKRFPLISRYPVRQIKVKKVKK